MVEVASSEGVDNYYLVRYSHGGLIGCFDLKYNGYVPHIRLLMTHAGSCRHELG